MNPLSIYGSVIIVVTGYRAGTTRHLFLSRKQDRQIRPCIALSHSMIFLKLPTPMRGISFSVVVPVQSERDTREKVNPPLILVLTP